MTNTLSADAIAKLEAWVIRQRDEIRALWVPIKPEYYLFLLSMAKRAIEMDAAACRDQATLSTAIDRAEKAEAERDHYRDMALRLATSVEHHMDETGSPTSADADLWRELSDPEIAALLSGHVKQSLESLHVPETCKDGLQGGVPRSCETCANDRLGADHPACFNCPDGVFPNWTTKVEITCSTCRHELTSDSCEPCVSCKPGFPNWEGKPDNLPGDGTDKTVGDF